MTLSEFYKKLILPTSFGENNPVSFYERVPNKADHQVTEVDIAKINLIVGANNSGKSQISRAILRGFPNEVDLLKSRQDYLASFISLITPSINEIPDSDWQNFHLRKVNRIYEIKLIKLYESYFDDCVNIIYLIIEYMLKKPDMEIINPSNAKHFDIVDLPTSIRKLLEYIFLLSQTSHKEIISINKYKEVSKLFFPNLRFLLTVNINDTLVDGFYENYKLWDKTPTKTEKFVNVCLGIETNESIFLHRNSADFNEVDKLYAFQEFLSIELFSGNRVMIIASQKGNKAEMKIRIGSEEPRFIYDLGEGVAQILILFWRLFQANSGIVVIDELEQNLHPGLQRHVLRLLAKHESFKNFIFFLPTHSNHLIECYNEFTDLMKVFNVAKRYDDAGNVKSGEFYFEDVSKRLDKAKESLQVNNTSVLLTNSVILVEGYTDLLYFRKYFETVKEAIQKEVDKLSRTYSIEQAIEELGMTRIANSLGIEMQTLLLMPNMRENLHFGFLYGSGKNVYNYTTLSNLPLSDYYKMEVENMKPILDLVVPKAKIFCDNDGKKKDNGEIEHPIYNHFKKEDVEILHVREIENTLTLEILDKCMHVFIKDSYTYTPNPEANKTMESPILEVIRDRVKLTDRLNSIEGSATSITSTYKKKLATEAIRHTTFENMSEEAKRIALLMFRHILHCNPDLRAGGR